MPLVPAALRFSINSPMTVGDPLTFSWSLQLFHSKSLGNSVTAALSVNGVSIWTAVVPVSANYVPGGWIEGTGNQQESLTFASDSPAARALFGNADTIPDKNLVLTVVGNGPDSPGPFSVNGSVQVLTIPLCFFIAWTWDTSTTTIKNPLPWPATYTLSGTCSSSSRFALTVTVTLLESTFGTPGTPKQTKFLGLGPKSAAGVPFDPIVQNWQWLGGPPSFDFIAATDIPFFYQISFVVQDPWGNQSFCSPCCSTSVEVAVSPAKVDEGKNASIAAGMSAYFLALAAIAWPTGGIFLALAASAYLIALTYAYNANDPPLPDPRYREAVEVKQVDDTIETSDSASANTLAQLFRLMRTMAADRETLSVVEGRIVGAMQASDRDALDMQVGKHTEITNHMQELSLQIAAASGAAIQAVGADPFFDSLKIREKLLQWREAGVPQEIRDAWQARQLPQEILSSIENLIKAAPAEGLDVQLPQQLLRIVLGVQNWAATAASQLTKLR